MLTSVFYVQFKHLWGSWMGVAGLSLLLPWAGTELRPGPNWIINNREDSWCFVSKHLGGELQTSDLLHVILSSCLLIQLLLSSLKGLAQIFLFLRVYSEQSAPTRSGLKKNMQTERQICGPFYGDCLQDSKLTPQSCTPQHGL